jgi:hypothetical protein
MQTAGNPTCSVHYYRNNLSESCWCVFKSNSTGGQNKKSDGDVPATGFIPKAAFWLVRIITGSEKYTAGENFAGIGVLLGGIFDFHATKRKEVAF